MTKEAKKSGITIKRPGSTKRSGKVIKRPSKEASKINEQDVSKFLLDVHEYMEGFKTEIVGGATLDMINYYTAALESMTSENDYSEAMEIVRNNREDFAKKHPSSAFVAAGIGGFGTGAGIAKLLTKGALKIFRMVAPKLIKNLPSSVEAFGSLTGGVTTGAIEAGLSEQARTGEEGAFFKGAKTGAMWGGGFGLPMAFLSKKKVLESAYKSLGPTKKNWQDINKNKENAKDAANTATQMLNFDVIKIHRSKKDMNEILQGSRKLNDHVLKDWDNYNDLDLGDTLGGTGGIIGKLSSDLDLLLAKVQKGWEHTVKRNEDITTEMYNAMVKSGMDPEVATKRIQAMREGKVIFGEEIYNDAAMEIKNAIDEKRMQFVSPSVRANLDGILKHLAGENHGLSLAEAQTLKKTLGKMVLDTNWAQLPQEASATKNALKKFYKVVRTHIEDSAETMGRASDMGEGIGDYVGKTNKELGGLIGAGKLLDASSAVEETSRINILNTAFIGTVGAGLGNVLGIGEWLGGGAALLSKIGTEKYGHQVMTKLHQGLGDQAIKGGITVGAPELFKGAFQEGVSGELPEELLGPQFIPRKKDDLKLNLPLIKSIVEQEAPHLTTELVNSAMHDDDETFIQILSDLAPEMENFVEQPPLKIKNIPMKSSFYSPTYEGEIRVGNDIEKNQVTEHIMNKEDITQKEKLAMVSQFIERSTITPEKPKEDQGLNQTEGLDSALREKRSLKRLKSLE